MRQPSDPAKHVHLTYGLDDDPGMLKMHVAWCHKDIVAETHEERRQAHFDAHRMQGTLIVRNV